ERLGLEGLLNLPPGLAFARAGDVSRLVRDLLANQQRPVPFQTELAEPVQQSVVVIGAWAVLLVVLDDLNGTAQITLFTAFPPEGRVEPRVELVMNAEKVTNVVPLEGKTLVVLPHNRVRRPAVAFDEAVHQAVGLVADDAQRRRFQWFDEAGRGARCHHILDPRPLVTATAKLERTGHFDFRVLVAELPFRLVVREKCAGVNVAAINKAIIID